jgi:uncharacterized protein YbjT (DUF2867 family)
MKVLLFGATGAAGGSVLTVCLNDRWVDEVRVITRRPLKLAHKKLLTLIHNDFLDYSSVSAAFSGVDACLFCLGVSVTQVRQEEAYRRITHDFALAAARLLKKESPNAAFHYISGYGTRIDGRQMWARVKGETERELIHLVGGICWRPGFIDTPPSESEPRLYRALKPVFRLLKPFRTMYVSGEDLGRAMLQTTKDRVRGRVIENAEIRQIAERSRT